MKQPIPLKINLSQSISSVMRKLIKLVTSRACQFFTYLHEKDPLGLVCSSTVKLSQQNIRRMATIPCIQEKYQEITPLLRNYKEKEKSKEPLKNKT